MDASTSSDSNVTPEEHSVAKHGILGIRKRVESSGDGSFLSISRGKRPRLSAMAEPSSYGKPNSIGFGADRLPRPRPLFDDDLSNASMSSSMYFSPGRRPLSRASSFTVPSCPPSPLPISRITGAPIGTDRFHQGVALMRSVSLSSLHSSASVVQNYPESSAKHFMSHARTTFDYSPPTDAPNGISARILSCSTSNVAYFTRGNRVHYKNITTNFNTDISQLCKLSEKWGNIRALEGGCVSQPNILAIGTSKGYIQIWDVKAKKATITWPTTKEITALAWNGPILSVGGIKGSIRHYDTRLPASKLKEQVRQVIRNHGQVTCLRWNEDGKFLASGDAAGTVHCWELGQKVPLEVGEFVSRRKKIQHAGKISAIAWCPWLPKLLATGDDKGILRLWNINAKDAKSNSLNPGKLDIGTVITGIHFSPHCKEILTTHGAQVGERTVIEQFNAPRPLPENAIAVHSFPSLRDVTTYSLPGAQLGAIGDSVLDGTGTKLIFATPSTNKIDVCTVWSKRKEIKKRPSFNEHASLMIR